VDSHSEEAKDKLREWAKGDDLIDVAFIDGDHSKDGMIQDFYLLLPYFKPDALVIFHDTVACPSVADALKYLLQKDHVRVIANFIAPKDEPPAFGITICKVSK